MFCKQINEMVISFAKTVRLTLPCCGHIVAIAKINIIERKLEKLKRFFLFNFNKFYFFALKIF